MELKKHITEKIHPEELFSEIVKGNKEYMTENQEHFLELKSGQQPDITLVTCCDSRIPPEVFGLDSLNELFVIRNIGNQFRNSEGSIKYSLFHLKTPILIIMGHTGCGAIQASLGDYREEDDAIQKEVIGLTNSVRIGKDKGNDENSSDDPVLRNCLYSETNVDHQIRKVISEYKIKPMVDDKKLTVLGMIFDIHGIYKVGSASIHLTNINGETDIEKIKSHSILSKLSQNEKEQLVRRLS